MPSSLPELPVPIPLSDSIAETQGYDSRLRLSSITDGSVYTLTIPATTGYAPNSDILAARAALPYAPVYPRVQSPRFVARRCYHSR